MGRKVKVDLTGVETFQRASEGLHVCKIASAEMKKSQSGNEMITVAYEVTKGEDKGSRVYENYPLVENALWKLKGMLQAIGMKADGKVQLDLDKLTGKVCQVNVIHEEYEGQIRARVESVMKLQAASEDEDEEDEDLQDDEDEEEEEKPTKKAKAAPKKKAPMNPPADEEDDDWDDEDGDDDDEDEEEEEPAPKKTKKAAKGKTATKAKSKKVAEDEDDDDDDDDDWDDV